MNSIVPCLTEGAHALSYAELIDPDTERKFLRTSCKNCGRWLGDMLKPQVNPQRALRQLERRFGPNLKNRHDN